MLEASENPSTFSHIYLKRMYISSVIDEESQSQDYSNIAYIDNCR